MEERVVFNMETPFGCLPLARILLSSGVYLAELHELVICLATDF